MNLPNSLTILRIFFVPLLVVVLLTREPNWNFWGLSVHFEIWGMLILLMAAATDAADGYFARKRAEITTLGILLDPIADKLLISAAFISLAAMGLAPAWMVVIIIGREFVVDGLRSIASGEGLIIPASTLGKTKMFLQVIAGCFVIYSATHPSFKLFALLLLGLVVISAVVSAVHYFLMFWSQVDDRIKIRQRASVPPILAQEKILKMCPLTDPEKRSLLSIARESIESALTRSAPPVNDSPSGNLAAPRGAFVTLHHRGRLHGCIGRIETLDSLATVVAECAASAATEDPRFAQLQPQDLQETEIEISVLSRPRQISAPEELQPGIHGLLVSRGRNRGILLPQVAQKYKWSREHFLEQTCRKAGLHPHAWKEPETRIEVFTAEVFSEAEFPATDEKNAPENKTPAGSSESAAGRR